MAASLNPLNLEVAPSGRHTPRSGRATDRERRAGDHMERYEWRPWQLLTPSNERIEYNKVMRFRLLSYVAAMLLLAGVAGVNLTPVTVTDQRELIWYSTDEGLGADEPICLDRAVHHASYGWPTAALIHNTAEFAPVDKRLPVDASPWPPIPVTDLTGFDSPVSSELSHIWLWPAFVLDLAIPIVGLLACEFVLRRYASRRKVE